MGWVISGWFLVVGERLKRSLKFWRY